SAFQLSSSVKHLISVSTKPAAGQNNSALVKDEAAQAELRELRATKLTRLLNEGPVTGRDAPKLSYLTQKILHRVVWPGEIQRRPAAITASRIRVYSAFGGISFFNVSASATVCASASVTLAVVVCVSTDAVTLECQ